MGRVRLAAIGLACSVACSCGCFLTDAFTVRTRVHRDAESTSARKVQPEVEPGYELQTRLIDQPAGSDYLNRELWMEAHDPLPHRHSAMLASNGIRVGVLPNPLPAEFERLMTSDGSVLDAMLRAVPKHLTKTVAVNGPLDHLHIGVTRQLGDAEQALELDGAECAFVFNLAEADEGKVLLRCEPQIQHGSKQRWWRTNPDGTEMEVEDKRTVEAFPNLSWTLSLDERDVLVIGSTEQPVNTLGEALFFTSKTARQRVFVLQARRSGSGSKAASRTVSASLLR